MKSIINDNEAIRLALLELACAFAADKRELRSYLQDVIVRNVGADVHIVAADGYMMCKIVIPNYQTVMPERITVDSIKRACKVSEASLLVASACTGTYPDYERFILTADTGKPRFNATYVAKMCTAITKAWSLIVETKIPEIDFITCSDTAGSLFKTTFKNSGITAEMVVMPMCK